MIINIHDYESENEMFNFLKELYPDERINSPQINYDNTSPGEIISELLMYDLPVFSDFEDQELQDEHIDLIVGTGLGGFIAIALSYQIYVRRKNIPVPTILLSPCLLPWVELPKLGYVDECGFFDVTVRATSGRKLQLKKNIPQNGKIMEFLLNTVKK